jgi:crotonobetainyl-CoA:carnitine CoA-transferase CaiB-like acyl-CoA transferase
VSAPRPALPPVGGSGQAPLAGVVVVELGQVLAGPFAGAIFADLGAEVIKIERPDVGDDARQMGSSFRHGDSLTFQVFNRGKRSVVIDLKTTEGREALDVIVAGADVLVHNLRPGVPEALGLDGATLTARHPRLVYVGMSAYGHVGPLARRPGYEPLVQAWSGLSSINGDPDGPPVRVGPSVCDQGTGMWAVIGALAALQQRARTGRGAVVQASLLETALVWAAQKGDAWLNEGRPPDRHASGHPGFVPYEAFDGADGPFLICVGNDRLFVKFAQALGRAPWADDPRFRTNRDRLAHKATLLDEIRAVLREHPRAHWLERLEAAGVPCAPIHTLPEALAQPQVTALGIVQEVPGEDFRLTGLPLSFDGERPALRAGAPRLGADTAAAGRRTR